MKQFIHTDIARSAELSACGRYRYLLGRCWRADAPQLGWVMLNPSTADALQDDPTIRKCMGFARAWGFGGIVVANLFHLRTTDPAGLWPERDPRQRRHTVPPDIHDRIRAYAVGPSDDWYGPVLDCPTMVAAWGSHDVVAFTGRPATLRGLATDRRRTLHCLAVNQDGQPRHPLYVPNNAKPIVWFEPGKAGPSA